jgi:hypothetical protein
MKLSSITFVLMSVMLVFSCTKKQSEEMVLVSSAYVLKTGDSLQLHVVNAPEAIQFTVAPALGSVTSIGKYYAPQTLYADSTWITLRAQSGSQTDYVNVLLVKSTAADTLISFNQTIMPLLVANCNFSGCHGNGSRAGKVDLTSYDSVMKQVVVFQPNYSLLYTSLIKTDELRRMPPAGPLQPYKLTWVRNWIEQGAHQN